MKYENEQNKWRKLVKKREKFMVEYVHLSRTKNGLVILRNDQTDLIKWMDYFSKQSNNFGYCSC